VSKQQQYRVLKVNGTTYHTRWPMQAFQVWHNMHPNTYGEWRLEPDVVCPHCLNDGVVIVDGVSPGLGVACPMCYLGGHQNRRWRVRSRMRVDRNGVPVVWEELPVGEWCWKVGTDLSGFSWNGGMSVWMTRVCDRCGVRPCLEESVDCGCSRPLSELMEECGVSVGLGRVA
jgi:hypothetical protein